MILSKRMRWTLAAAAILALFLAWTLGRNAARTADATAVVARVRQLNQLATVEYTVERVVGVREPKQPLGEESILLIVRARVQAGVRLDGLKEGDIVKRKDGATAIRLPRPEILSVTVDEKQTKVWDRRVTWWTPWVPFSLDLEKTARQRGLDAAREAALEMGILDQAERNAQSSIRTLLGLAGIEKVEFIPSGTS